MNKNSKYSAPALDKGLDIIEYLSATAAPSSQAEIAQGLQRSPNEIYRVLVGLEARGYLIRDSVSGKYRLSLKLYTLSHTHSPIEQLREAAHLPMVELAESVGQSCHLSVPYENKLMVVSQVKSPNPVSLSISEGALFPIFSTTSGRVLLANYSDEHKNKLLSEDPLYLELDPGQKSTILSDLSKIKTAGHQIAPSEITVGVTDCAAFVGQAGSDLMAAIAVSSLTTNIGEKRDKNSIIEAVQKAAHSINQRIGIESSEP